MISKKDGEHQLKADETLNDIILQSSKFIWIDCLLRIALRNAHNFTVARRTCGGRIPLRARGSSCLISTW